MSTEELLEIVDKHGNTIYIAPRSVIHGNPSLIHKVVHVLVFNESGELLLQKRSANKDVARGKWDTSVGGHVAPAESLLVAAQREMQEEIGIITDKISPLYSYILSNSYETELVYSYVCIHNGPFSFNREEIDEIRFWDIPEIKKALGQKILSDDFEFEINRCLSFYTHIASAPAGGPMPDIFRGTPFPQAR
ncbi:MAG: NUDIX domain-containing protein [Thermodesulfobacteriota bacterium]|nr:NUDIX domain-containing protein [Thermodesulfobacteriota bacterium]